MLKFFHLEKNASPFISVGSINLFTLIGSLILIFCCRPPIVKLKWESAYRFFIKKQN